MTSARRIGVIATSFPRCDADFAGRFVFELSRGLSRRGHRVDVVVPEPRDETDWTDNPGWLEGLSVFPAPYFRPRRCESLFFGAGVPENLRQHPTRLALVPPALLSLYIRAGQLGPRWDALISHWLFPSAFIGGLSCRNPSRHLAIAHSGDVHLLGLTGMRWLHRLLSDSAGHFGFISRTLEKKFRSMLSPPLRGRFRGRTHLTPMGIEPDAFHDKRPADAERPFTILYLGRLVPIKGVSLLIDAVSGLDGVTLSIAGDGPLRSALESQARRASIPIRFLGAIAPRDRRDVFREADLFVLPSIASKSGRSEGLPLTLLEAMAAGVPVIASNTGGVAELITDRRNGLLFPPEQVHALRTCIAELRDHPPLRERLTEAGMSTARGRSWDNLLPIFERLLGLRKARS